MDFYKVVKVYELDKTQTTSPFSGKISGGDWEEGLISINYLNEHFGHLETAEEMINATESEGLKLYFAWLKEKGILN